MQIIQALTQRILIAAKRILIKILQSGRHYEGVQKYSKKYTPEDGGKVNITSSSLQPKYGLHKLRRSWRQMCAFLKVSLKACLMRRKMKKGRNWNPLITINGTGCWNGRGFICPVNAFEFQQKLNYKFPNSTARPSLNKLRQLVGDRPGLFQMDS